MSVYSTDEVLRMMERCYEQQKANGISTVYPFQGFDGLLGADLRDIDLSKDTIDLKVEEYRRAEGADPPWVYGNRLDLRGAFLSTIERRTDLRRAQLQGVILADSQLQEAILTDAQLQEVVLWRDQLQGAFLVGAQLQGAELQGAYLCRARLQEANLQRAQLQGAFLFGAQLQGAVFQGARLRGANLFQAQLQGADLSRAQLQEAILQRAQLREANLAGAQLQGAQLQGADLQRAQLQEADLQEADLQEAQLQRAELREAQLQGADPWRAQLRGADLRSTDLVDVDLEDVVWGDHVLSPELLRDFDQAESQYRRLKQYCNGRGQLDVAGEFQRRELFMRRKKLAPGPDIFYPPLVVAVVVLTVVVFPLKGLSLFGSLSGFNRGVADVWTWLGAQREAQVLLATGFLMGHGERPSWVLGWVVLSWLGFALTYWHFGALLPETSFIDSVRYSASLILAAGTAERPVGTTQWSKDAALVQSFVSYVLLALFLVTFVRKVSPR